jgi:hypothetical protein
MSARKLTRAEAFKIVQAEPIVEVPVMAALTGLCEWTVREKIKNREWLWLEKLGKPYKFDSNYVMSLITTSPQAAKRSLKNELDGQVKNVRALRPTSALKQKGESKGLWQK